MEKNGMGSFSRLVLNSLYAKDPSWLWMPYREVEAVRVGQVCYVRSRTRPGLVHVVRGGECSCEAARYGLGCWHLEACEYAEVQDRAPAWAPREEVPAFAGVDLLDEPLTETEAAYFGVDGEVAFAWAHPEYDGRAA